MIKSVNYYIVSVLVCSYVRLCYYSCISNNQLQNCFTRFRGNRLGRPIFNLYFTEVWILAVATSVVVGV